MDLNCIKNMFKKKHKTIGVINTNYLKSLSPCSDRYKNWLTHYKNFDGSLIEFLNLENISCNDKIWVIKNLITKPQAVRWAIYCAESVLNIYESQYPDDFRPRAAIDAALIYERDPSQENKDAANAAYAAAYAAADAAADATDAAYAATNAAYAAYAATNAANAANAAAYAASAAADAANAAYAATYAATYAAYAATNAAAENRGEKEREVIQLLIKSIQEVE